MMEKISGAIEAIGGFLKGVTGLLITFLALGVVGQILLGEAIFGMDVIGNIVAVIGTLGNSGFVGILAVIVLYGILSKDK